MDLKRRQTEGIISESSADSWKYRAVDAASRRLQTYRRRKNSPEEARIYGTWNSHSPLIQSYEQLRWRGGLRRWREGNFSISFSCDERFRPVVSTKVQLNNAAKIKKIIINPCYTTTFSSDVSLPGPAVGNDRVEHIRFRIAVLPNISNHIMCAICTRPRCSVVIKI